MKQLILSCIVAISALSLISFSGGNTREISAVGNEIVAGGDTLPKPQPRPDSPKPRRDTPAAPMQMAY